MEQAARLSGPPVNTRRTHPHLAARAHMRNLTTCGTFDVIVAVLLDPGHHPAQIATNGLDRVLLTLGAKFLELRSASILIVDEALGELARLNVGEHGAHVVLDVGVDHARSGHVVAVLGGVRDRLVR